MGDKQVTFVLRLWSISDNRNNRSQWSLRRNKEMEAKNKTKRRAQRPQRKRRKLRPAEAALMQSWRPVHSLAGV